MIDAVSLLPIFAEAQPCDSTNNDSCDRVYRINPDIVLDAPQCYLYRPREIELADIQMRLKIALFAAGCPLEQAQAASQAIASAALKPGYIFSRVESEAVLRAVQAFKS
jgi:hypothetical protein